MEKFLKVTLGGTPYLININQIIGIDADALVIKVYLNLVGKTATTASEVIGYQLKSTAADTNAKVQEQLRAFVGAMETALKTSWQHPVYDITSAFPYALTEVRQIEDEWSA